MRRALYDPPALFGLSFLKPEPVEVELLDWIEPLTPQQMRMARIRVPVPKEALINILAKIPVEKRKVTYVIREVPADDVTLIEVES